MIRPALAAVIASCAVLAGTIAFELPSVLEDDGAMTFPVPTTPPARRGLAAPPPVPGQDADAGGNAFVATTLARPLFASTRRPARTSADDATPADLPRLAGVLVDPSRRNAIFAAADGGRPIVVTEGGRVGSYTVQTIEAGQVTLDGPGGPRVIRPSFDPRPPRPAPSPPVPGGPTPAAPSAATAPGAPGAVASEVMPSLRSLPGFGGPDPAR